MAPECSRAQVRVTSRTRLLASTGVYWETVTFTYPFVQQHWSSGVLSTGLKLSARTRRTYSPGSLKVTVVVARLPASSSGSGRSSLNNATAGP